MPRVAAVKGALCFSSFLTMPARKKKAQAAAKTWQHRKAKPSLSKRPSRLRKWSDESMKNAIAAVRAGGVGVNQAARNFDIPPTTLKDRLSGRVEHGKNFGPVPYLTAAEEDELVEFLTKCAAMGLGKTKREVFNIVERTLKKRGCNVDKFNGEGWWNRFRERQPRISLRSSDALSRVRANAVTKDNMKKYFSLLKETLVSNNLLDKPSCIYNMDESGMPLDYKQPKRIAPKGMKKVHGLSTGNKSQITIVACGNAAGPTLPPMVIFKGERFNHEWSVGEVPGTLYGMSENGWIDQELFYYWFKNVFLKNIPAQRPVILLCDGHSSHYTPEVIAEAATHGVVLFCIPPNTTHVSQPLDVSFFGPLKHHWTNVCHQFLSENPGASVTKLIFSSLFSQVWYKGIKPENIINGFRKTGVFPFNEEAIKVNELPSSDTESVPESPCESPLHKETELVFTDEQIALYEQRYENGYNLCIDSGYVSWMSIHHPGVLPSSSGADRSSDGDTSDMAEGDWSSSPELFSTPSGVPSPNVHPGMATPTGAPIVHPGVATPTDPPIVHPGVTTPTDPPIVHHGVATPTDAPIVHAGVATPTDPPIVHHGVTSPTDAPIVHAGVATPTDPPIVTPSMATPCGSSSDGSSTITTPSVSESSSSTRKVLSSLTEFLTFPSTPKRSKQGKKNPGPARVLTSQQSLETLLEKERKKKEEEEAKEQRAKEREEKRLQREVEKERKARERELKQLERQKKKEELELQKKQRREELEQRRKDKQAKPPAKGKKTFTKTFITRSKARAGDGYVPQNSESTSNECTICFGDFADDLGSDGFPTKNWVQCTNEECSKWMHEDCIMKNDEDNLVCFCGNAFL